MQSEKAVRRVAAARPDMHITYVFPGWMCGQGDAGPTSAGQTLLDVVRGRLPGIPPGSFLIVGARDVGARRYPCLPVRMGVPVSTILLQAAYDDGRSCPDDRPRSWVESAEDPPSICSFVHTCGRSRSLCSSDRKAGPAQPCHGRTLGRGRRQRKTAVPTIITKRASGSWGCSLDPFRARSAIPFVGIAKAGALKRVYGTSSAEKPTIALLDL